MTSDVAAAPSSRTAVPHPTLSQLWVFVAVALPVVAMLLPNLSTIDLAYQIRAGNVMLDTHRVLSRDLFTFTVAGRPWLNQQWGAELVFAALFRAGGWPFLILIRALLSGAIFWLVHLACRLRGAERKPAAFLAIASLAVALPGLILRPQLLGLALFALTLVILSARHRWSFAPWVVVPIVALWANVHGSFFLGPLLLAFASFEDRAARLPAARTTWLAAVVSLLAANLNPYGIKVWSYAFGISTNKVITDTIGEWRPPTIRSEPGLVFFLSASAVVVLLARRDRPPPLLALAQLGVFFVIGLFAVRGIYWWALAAPVILAPLVARRNLGGAEEERSSVNTAIAAMLVVLALAFLPWWRSGGPQGSVALLDHAPIGVTRALETVLVPGERVFAPQIWGSWLEYATPRNPVFVDARIEIFPLSVWRDYDRVSGGGQGWNGVVDRWHVDVIVASRLQQAALIPYVSADPGWRVVYSSSAGVVAVRR